MTSVRQVLDFFNARLVKTGMKIDVKEVMTYVVLDDSGDEFDEQFSTARDAYQAAMEEAVNRDTNKKEKKMKRKQANKLLKGTGLKIEKVYIITEDEEYEECVTPLLSVGDAYNRAKAILAHRESAQPKAGYVIIYGNRPEYKGTAHYLKLLPEIGESTIVPNVKDATVFPTKKQADRAAEEYRDEGGEGKHEARVIPHKEEYQRPESTDSINRE